LFSQNFPLEILQLSSLRTEESFVQEEYQLMILRELLKQLEVNFKQQYSDLYQRFLVDVESLKKSRLETKDSTFSKDALDQNQSLSF